MHLLALLIGLGAERLLTQLFHLREFRWLDPAFDLVFKSSLQSNRNLSMLVLLCLAALIVLPVVALALLLQDSLAQIPYFLFAVLVLLFSLGPRDLKQEVEDYCAALAADGSEEIRRVSKELLEIDPPPDPVKRAQLVERAIFVQANNRIFGVVFWFVLLGPAGAWLFRILDMMRRRAAYNAMAIGDQPGGSMVLININLLHAVFAWLPARLLIMGFALAGRFDEAMTAWRDYYSHRGLHFVDLGLEFIGWVGQAATGGRLSEAEFTDTHTEVQFEDSINPSERAREALDLVGRTLWKIWCPILALMTLYDWIN
jgi:AmpE protein